MIDKLDFMVRFWQLRARHEGADPLVGRVADPLSAVEQVELLALHRLMSTDLRLPEPGPAPRNEQGIPVQLTAPQGFLAAELRMVCADGIVLACATPMRGGQFTIVRLADAVSGLEYTLPCVIEWGYTGRPSAMALRVDGVPARMTFAIPERGMWRSPLSWAEPHTIPPPSRSNAA
jgi:hypothetical protein